MDFKTNNPAPRVGVNAHLLNLSGSYRTAGINWYTYNLLRNLDSSAFDFTIFLSEPRAEEHFRHLRLSQSLWPTTKPIARIIWEQCVLPTALRRSRSELLHAMAFAGPIMISIPWVVTIYDLSFLRYPQSFNVTNRLYLSWAVRHSIRHADRVIAISESTKRDLVQFLGAPPSQVDVVYGGIDTEFASSRPAQVELLRARYRLPEKFILHVGTIEPRKNIVRLLRDYALAKRTAHLPHRLVLVGGRGWKYEEVDAVIEKEGIGGDVLFTGFAAQEDMPAWYQAADLFVYPSLFEGFGLPPLEAMASGTPVVTSNAASLPEVVGDAAIVVPPEDETALADAIVRGVCDFQLRDAMRARGRTQAAKFSWADSARQTMDIYRAVLEDHCRPRNPQRGGARHAAG
jgi:glycosyltransferase involved in cell wall biosynthesis